jgi:hypothetical protein
VPVRDRRQAVPVGDIVECAAHHGRSAGPPRHGARSLRRGIGGDGVDAPDLRREAGDRGEFRGVAPHDVDVHRAEDPFHRCAAQPGGAHADRIEHHRHAGAVRLLAGGDHRFDPRRLERPDVEHEAPGMAHHLTHLLERVGHHRRRPDVQRDVGRVVHHDVVGDLVDERAAGPDLRQCVGCHGSQVELSHGRTSRNG